MKIIFNSNSFINKVNQEVGNLLTNQAKENIKKRSLGRVYYYKGRPYIASKPFDPPNIRSGDLYRTVNSVLGSNKVTIGEGNSKVDYAVYLEKGTSKMQPRPNLINIISKNEKRIYSIINKNLKNYLKGVSNL